MQYDICIIGAGPCGLMAAMELCREYKICIIDVGREFNKRICNLDRNLQCNENCNPCNVISGYGGCQFLDGTKACFFPAGSGLLKFKSEDEICKYYEKIENKLVELGKPIRKNNDKKIIDKIVREFNDYDIDVKYYNAQKIDKNIMRDIGLNIRKKLLENNVDFIYEDEVLDIEHKELFNVYTPKRQLSANKVILATGRYGGLFLNKLSKKLGIEYSKNNFVGELGVRIEMSYNVFDKVNDIFNDIKLKRKVDDENEIRTFCQNYKGIIRKCVFDYNNNKISSLDGAILGPEENNTKSVNIAIHHRINNITEINEFNQMIIRANKNSKPIVQSMKSFLEGGNEGLFDEDYSTMKDYVIDDINKYLPQDTLEYIKQMIIDIDKVLPGFADDRNIVYAPSFELGVDKYVLSNNFETNIKGLYIGGDACGYFRGIMQAMISGKIISDEIRKKDCKYENTN